MKNFLLVAVAALIGCAPVSSIDTGDTGTTQDSTSDSSVQYRADQLDRDQWALVMHIPFVFKSAKVEVTSEVYGNFVMGYINEQELPQWPTDGCFVSPYPHKYYPAHPHTIYLTVTYNGGKTAKYIFEEKGLLQQESIGTLTKDNSCSHY